MPGFAINATDSGTSKDFKAEFRRKHRWRVTDLSSGPVSPRDFLYLQSTARPNFKIEPAPVHHDQEVAYFGGKQEWDPLPLTFYDAATRINISQRIYDWVNVCTNIGQATVSAPDEYKKELTVQMTDGQGSVDEEWKLYGAWVMESNWNELDYTSSDVQLVTLSVRFDRAEKLS